MFGLVVFTTDLLHEFVGATLPPARNIHYVLGVDDKSWRERIHEEVRGSMFHVQRSRCGVLRLKAQGLMFQVPS